MKFERFIKKHKVNLKPDILELCNMGVSMMEKSIDPIHDKKHIEEIFSNFDFLIRKEPSIKRLITWDILLLAICWHDTWKSSHLTKNPLKFIIHQLVEGLGSARLFKKQAKKQNLDKALISKVYYTIRKHSFFQFLPSRSLEVKILLDLDDIEMWNFKRLQEGSLTLFVNKRSFYKRSTKIFYKILAKKKLNFSVLETLIEENKRKVLDMF